MPVLALTAPPSGDTATDLGSDPLGCGSISRLLQEPVSGSVIVPVSGAGTQVQPVTAAPFEFGRKKRKKGGRSTILDLFKRRARMERRD